jgi:hypothetical protein
MGLLDGCALRRKMCVWPFSHGRSTDWDRRGEKVWAEKVLLRREVRAQINKFYIFASERNRRKIACACECGGNREPFTSPVQAWAAALVQLVRARPCPPIGIDGY